LDIKQLSKSVKFVGEALAKIIFDIKQQNVRTSQPRSL